MIYLMADIHGRYNEFIDMLKKINFKETDFLYIIGDVIDRRPNGIKLLKYIMNTDNIELIKGNHEQMMYNSVKIKEENLTDELSIIRYYDWMRNGGNITFEEYKDEDWKTRENIMSFLENLETFKILRINNINYILVHAGLYIPEGYKIPEELSLKKIFEINKNRDICLYIREDFLDVFEYIPNYKIIFGHTPTVYIPEYVGYVTPPMSSENLKRCKEHKIYITEHKIGIDCEENLSCLRLNDMKEFYVKNYKTSNI